MDSPFAVLAHQESQHSHRTLAEKAFDTLHNAIIAGQLRPGARLPIEELAGVLQMSPMPIREAVRRLDAAGLVENIPHRGARVTELSIGDLAEVYEVRLALESLAIRRAAERFTDADARHARRCMTFLHHRVNDTSPIATAAHARFHFALYQAAHSAWLLRLIQPAWESAERYSLEVPGCCQAETRRRGHEAILGACAANDPDNAELALRAHLSHRANRIAVAMGGKPLYELAAAG